MRRRLPTAALAAVLTVTLALPAAAAPLSFPTRVVEGFPAPPPPAITAAAWILFDDSTGTVLGSQLPDEERPMASTTKIMTALVAIENAEPKSIVTISQNAADTGEREIDLVAGEQLPLDALLKAAMIHSANDAATAIAEHVGGSVSGFIDMMNEKAAELGLTETHFVNPHGLDHPDHYSSARDLLSMARVAMEHPLFADIVRSRLLVFPDAPDGTRRAGVATNLMLHDYEGMGGVKTGFTFRAGLTMVATAERSGRRLYAVVLGSDGSRAHFSDVRALFDWGFESLGIHATLSTGQAYTSMKTRVEPSPLLATRNTETFLHLAAQGLMTSPPAPLTSLPPPEPPPLVVVERYPQPSEPPAAALAYWWELLRGGP